MTYLMMKLVLKASISSNLTSSSFLRPLLWAFFNPRVLRQGELSYKAKKPITIHCQMLWAYNHMQEQEDTTSIFSINRHSMDRFDSG